VFAVATSNLGIGALIMATASTGSAVLPVSLAVPITGQCFLPRGPSAAAQINAGATPTFGISVTAAGGIPLDPANRRIFVVFTDRGGVVRGWTSVAVTTQ